MKYILSIFLLFVFLAAKAGTVDTVTIYSKSMKKEIKCIVIKPDRIIKAEKYPVVYLLHGHGGRFDNWIKLVPQLKLQADQHNLIIVCPDGQSSSWYFDSPVDSSMRYETFIGKEVPEFIDGRYPTIKNRTGRAITGLSMGGHGGLFIGFRHSKFFGACGSMSGALLIEFITDKRYNIHTRLGDTTNKDLYRSHSIIGEMDKGWKDSIAVIIDCGTEDFIFQMSKMVHEKMTQLKIPHDYIERPGKHDWKYWANAVQYQLLFFRNYFDRQVKSTAKGN